eukprot:TRINITY_DN2058_c0_g2_i1.p1 TRINITY_DN2058_c0_g2~~TRINITY_DN2058_c0_g2_i1.p1  ORF type:complete len:122 (+),score=23.59 TRINITY_DN2058_c0_g2_i1:688-1053(+)
MLFRRKQSPPVPEVAAEACRAQSQAERCCRALLLLEVVHEVAAALGVHEREPLVGRHDHDGRCRSDQQYDKLEDMVDGQRVTVLQRLGSVVIRIHGHSSAAVCLHRSEVLTCCCSPSVQPW